MINTNTWFDGKTAQLGSCVHLFNSDGVSRNQIFSYQFIFTLSLIKIYSLRNIETLYNLFSFIVNFMVC